VSADPVWAARPIWQQATLAELWRASDEALQAAIRHSPMYRTKIWRIRRNLALAIAASGDDLARAALLEDRDPSIDPSLGHPVVIEHVAWARTRIGEAER
jgi:epoxyqueuosine reductase QueG